MAFDLIDALSALGDKHEPVALFVLMLLPLVLGGALWWIIEQRIAHGAPARIRWGSVVPVVAGALLAMKPLKDVGNSSYRSFYTLSERSIGLHYASFFVPLAALLILVSWIIWRNREDRLER